MHIIRLESENFKKLRAVAIEPDGSIVQITGANGSGKTSVLDSIFAALAGASASPDVPVRQGEDEATIKLTLGNGEPELIVTRRFTSAGATHLLVQTPNDAVYKRPQDVLDGLLGKLTFDPLAFARMKPKERLETLRGCVILATDIDEIDRRIAEAFEERTAINRTAKSLTERVKTLTAGVDPEMDVTLHDTGALLEQLQQAAERNTAIDREIRHREDMRTRASDLRAQAAGDLTIAGHREDEAEDLMRAAKELRQQAANLQKNAEALDETYKGLPALDEPIDTRVLGEEIRAKQRENQTRQNQLTQRAKLAEEEQELRGTTEMADKLTGTIDALKLQKTEAISSAKFPVDGLSFGDDGVLLKGLPFEQASSAEQLSTSTAIGMAANPKLRVMRITDGSLLDDNSLKLLASLAEERGFQIWIESVDTTGKVGIFMEDGSVKAVNAK